MGDLRSSKKICISLAAHLRSMVFLGILVNKMAAMRSLRTVAFFVVALQFVRPTPALAQLSTLEHVSKPGFWPTKVLPTPAEFVGVSVCAKCHSKIADLQKTTPMAQSLLKVANSDALLKHTELTLQLGQYGYEIKTTPAGSIYSVTDGERKTTAPLIWAFGGGQVGQSYLFERDGRWYEAHVSYFGSLEGLQITPGRGSDPVRDMEGATSRTLTREDVVRCFKCHATGITSEHAITTTISPGITCEACHGPGAKHAAQKQIEILATGGSVGGENADILNPGRLSPGDSVDFCGGCHATTWDVRLAGNKGIQSLLSPPSRLQKSKCWGNGDERLTCVACHDPHTPRVREAEYYDAKCLACHAPAGQTISAEHPQPACKVGSSKCVTCHMPKLEVPDFYHSFPDHRIRIVRAGEPFPE